MLHVQTLYFKAGSSDKGRDYAKWYIPWNQPLSTSQARALAESSMLHQDAKKKCFRNSYVCLYFCIHFRPVVHANASMHDLFPSEIVIAPPISRLHPAHQELLSFRCCTTTRNSVVCLCLKYRLLLHKWLDFGMIYLWLFWMSMIGQINESALYQCIWIILLISYCNSPMPNSSEHRKYTKMCDVWDIHVDVLCYFNLSCTSETTVAIIYWWTVCNQLIGGVITI